MSADSQAKYLYSDEAASRLGRTPEGTRHMANRGHIPRYSVVNGVSIFCAREFEEFLADPDGWRARNATARVAKPEHKRIALRRASQSKERLEAVLACLRKGPITSIDLAAQCDAYGPRLVGFLRRQGYTIKTKRIRATDADGIPRVRIAQYTLVEAG